MHRTRPPSWSFALLAWFLAAGLAAQGTQRVKVTAAFAPPTAKPGDEVVLELKAAIEPNYHIYGAKDPAPAKVAIKDAAGLEPKGKAELPDGVLHKHGPISNWWVEGDVEIRQRFVVPAAAAGGERVVQGQVEYIACTPEFCEAPARARFKATLAVDAPAAAGAAPSEPPKAKKYTTEKVTFTPRFVPAVARAGEQVKLVVEVEVAEGWHVYGSRETTGIPTKLRLREAAGLGANADPVVPPGEEHGSGAFAAYWILGRFEATQTFVVPDTASPGLLAPKGEFEFMACDESSCLNPEKVEFEAPLAIEAGAVRDERKPSSPARDPAATAKVPPDDEPDALAPIDPKSVDLTNAMPRFGLIGDGKVRVPPVVVGDEGKGGGLWGLILLCIGGGLIALVMPCTYPMIPITFSFFTKQADARGGKVLPLALAYGLGIVGIFVLVGVAVGPVIVTFAAHWITNLVIGAVFVWFALVLFGVVNLEPPRAVQNLAGKARTTGGLLGVFLMGATLVVTSFTCTAPIVGSVLSATARGESSVLDAAIGMGAFGLTMAIPFVLLALLPGKVKALPKSGEWMNTLKVSLGFVELAAALKFLSNADIVLDLRVLPREVFLGLWAVTFAALGAYLFGVLRKRTGGEPQPAVSGTRKAFGGLSAVFAAYCTWGLLGNQLDYVMTAFEPNYQIRAVEEHAIVTDDHEGAMQSAKAQGKLVLVNFTGFT